MIDGARTVGEAGVDVLTRQVGEIGKQFIGGGTCCERVEDVYDAHPRARDDRTAAANFGVDDYALIHAGILRVVFNVVKTHIPTRSG